MDLILQYTSQKLSSISLFNNQQEQRREQHLEPEETPKIAAGTTITNQVF
jgi:hypothetical protein